MTEEESDAVLEEGARPAPAGPPAWIGLVLRVFARLWVISFLLLVAAFGGISVYQLHQSQDELTELRKAPGPQPYAVVAYRRELAREVRAYGRNWRNPDAVPTPPSRPWLLEEIDIARRANAEFRRAPERRPQQVGAPP